MRQAARGVAQISAVSATHQVTLCEITCKESSKKANKHGHIAYTLNSTGTACTNPPIAHPLAHIWLSIQW